MNDKSILNKFAYHLIMHYKTIHYNELKILSERNVESINIPLLDLISLYIIDYDNLNGEIFSKTEQATVARILLVLEKDYNSSLEIKTSDLKNLLKNCKTHRLPKSLHDRVCSVITKYNNDTYAENEVRLINKTSLQKILDTIKYPQE